MLKLSGLYAHNAEFESSYDGYWKALLLSDKMENNHAKASALYGLGWLYSLYKRDSLAETYFRQSIVLKKSAITKPNFGFNRLSEMYYALATLYRKQAQTDLARRYLDSCKWEQGIQLKDIRAAFIRAELGYNLHLDGKPNEALGMLLPLQTYFKENHHSYLVIYHAKLADIYTEKGNLELAEPFYRGAIDAGIQHKSHMDLMPDIYENLSKLLIKKGKSEQAYLALLESKRLNESQFDSRSAKNQLFIEIKDEYRQIKEAQEKQLRQQEIEQLMQEDKIWYLKSLIAYGTIIFLIILIFLTYRYFRNRYKAEKKMLSERRKLEQQKAREVLEVKNKELTLSALQLIQREELLTSLKTGLEELRKNPNKAGLGKLAQSIRINDSNNWKEFEARFVAVNKSFYKQLNLKFPRLTQGDQKICALIKLNFDSKDMARLLGISVESVHTTRYRLRKKLNLKRSDNLEEFVSRIDHK